jgi:hypothetical protein
VLHIQHSELNRLFVLFENSVDCFFAQKILNGHLITIQLYNGWATQPELAVLNRTAKLAGPNFPKFEEDVSSLTISASELGLLYDGFRWCN